MIRKPIRISPNITVGPQPSHEMLEKLSAQGFKSVINLSKKGELGQILNPDEELDSTAGLGMKYAHIPISLSTVKESQIAEFCKTIEELPGPIYIHCRIGQRCGPLAMIYHAIRKKLDSQQTLLRAEKLGLQWQAPMISRLITSYLDKHYEAMESNA